MFYVYSKNTETILDAKRDGREIKDGEFQTACSAACGNGAMAFGDINDKQSKVANSKRVIVCIIY